VFSADKLGKAGLGLLALGFLLQLVALIFG